MQVTYMRYDQVPSHKHQVIDPDPRPVLLRPVSSPCHICADFARTFKEQPDVIAFLHPARAAWRAFAIVEGEGNDDLGRLDCFLDLVVFFPQLLLEMAFARESGLCHSSGSIADGRIRLQALLRRHDGIAGLFSVDWEGG